MMILGMGVKTLHYIYFYNTFLKTVCFKTALQWWQENNATKFILDVQQI